MPSTSRATKEDNQVLEGEIWLAAFTAEHNVPFTIMDHMPKLLVAVCPNSSIAKKIASSQTKATAFVKRVTGH